MAHRVTLIPGDGVAVFEPTHGSAPKYAGQNRVEVIRDGGSVTYDMKPHRDDPTAVGTSEVADAIIEKPREK
jgi:isocitrate dehydrogenase (NAD+)